jgi:hypothetical protein
MRGRLWRGGFGRGNEVEVKKKWGEEASVEVDRARQRCVALLVS